MNVCTKKGGMMARRKAPHVIKIEMGERYVVVFNTTEPMEPEDARPIAEALTGWYNSSLPFFVIPLPPDWEVKFEKVEQ